MNNIMIFEKAEICKLKIDKGPNMYIWWAKYISYEYLSDNFSMWVIPEICWRNFLYITYKIKNNETPSNKWHRFPYRAYNEFNASFFNVIFNIYFIYIFTILNIMLVGTNNKLALYSHFSSFSFSFPIEYPHI